ncbi:MAG: hypothetical protein ACD_22C00234G0015 [uncultured bacterium]|nr:MAG: hypothetical protein ACD_22C00234G0015 [uncultured bacterium]
MNDLRVCDLPTSEKPRERLINYGISTLSNTELLAIILRSGGTKNSVIDLAGQIFSKYNGFNGLLNLDVKELTQFKNIGVAKASSIKAACEIALRISKEAKIVDGKESVLIIKAQDVFDLVCKDFYGKEKEYLYVVTLDSRNNFISKDIVSIGTVNETVVSPREVFKLAFQKNAVSVVLTHNHPTGDPTPSLQDIKITERVAKAGADLGIALMDHVIIANDKFVSIKSLNLFDPISFS